MWFCCYKQTDIEYSKISLHIICTLFTTKEEDKENLEPWLVKEMDQLLTDAWLSGSDDVFSQIFHLIMSEHISGQWIISLFAQLFIDLLYEGCNRKTPNSIDITMF